MSLRILFADDSVTAQNMGRKILTEAGYEVVAVSNGAAAVKKIAEQKPDIIILDVYMPGYSGLEVCEKVRGSMETLKTPVLLTVGKMEPYKPEDANRVRADGVIVKPFEASDLLAIVKKFEERIAQSPVMAQQPVLVDRLQEEVAEPSVELSVELPMAPASSQPTVEVPDHMATTSAFSDLLGAEPSVSGNHFEPPSPSAAEEAPSAPFSVRNPVPDYELPASWREREEPVPPAPAAERVQVRPAVVEPEPEPVVPPPPPAASHPPQIPVYEERAAARSAYEVVPTSAPPIGNIEIPREPQLEDSVAEATRNTVAEAVDPALVPAHRQFEARPASGGAMAAAELAPVEEPFTPAGFQDIPADIVSHLPPPVAEAVPAAPLQAPPAERLSDADFEARVAAAMSAYSHAQEAPQTGSHRAAPEFPAARAGLDQQRADVLGIAEEAMQTGVEIQPESAAARVPSPAMKPPNEPLSATESAPPVFEYHPPVHAAPAEPVSETQAPESAPVVAAATHPKVEPMAAPPTRPSEPPVAEAVATSHDHEALAASIKARLPEVAAAAGAGADHHTISQAVHRVMERLKPELVDEILRELKSKKE